MDRLHLGDPTHLKGLRRLDGLDLDGDCRDLAWGDWSKVETDLQRTFAALEKCRGAILAVGNHLAPDISADMLARFFSYLLPRLAREQ